MGYALCDLSVNGARADALFASALQRSDEPSTGQVQQAVAVAIRAFGDLGCAARVAQAYGEHPETAITRMRWARSAVAGAFGSQQSETAHHAEVARHAVPLPRLAPRGLARSPNRSRLGMPLAKTGT